MGHFNLYRCIWDSWYHKLLYRRMEMVEKGNISVREAGRKGGLATSRTHGHEFYESIGHKGGSKGGQRVRELIARGKERL
jgi:hypothetical protein